MPDNLNPQRASPSLRSAFVAILGDRIWQLFALLSVAVSLPIAGGDSRSAFSELWADPVMLIALLWVIGSGLWSLGERERHFWQLWAGAIGCWLAVRLSYVVAPSSWAGTTFDLVTDCAYMLFYLLLFLAAVTSPHLPHRSNFGQRLRMLRLIGSTALVFGILIYFVLVPGHVKPELYRSWLPSFDLYVALDLLLALTLGLLARTCGNRRWAIIYGLLAATAGGWAAVDLLEGLSVTGRIAWKPGPNADFLWQIPGLAIAAAARGRYLIREDTEMTASLVRVLSVNRLGSPLLLSAVALPAIHLMVHSAGLGDRDLQPVREVLVLFGVVLLTTLAFAEQRLMHRELLEAVAERRQAEKRTIERSIFLDALIKQSPLGITSFDPEHRVTLCNPAFERLFGYREAELKGRSLQPFTLPEYRADEATELAQRTISGEPISVITQRHHRDGRVIDVEVSAVPLIIDNALVGHLAFYRDLSGQMRAEAGRRVVEQRLRRLTEAAFEGIAVVDGDRIGDANQQLAAMFGYEPGTLRGMFPVELFAPTDRPELEALLEVARRRPVEIEGLHQDRTTFRVEVRARSGEDGNQDGCVLAIRDLTERLELEAQLQQAQKMEAIGRLAGGIAHDFNNLLTVVLGRCELLSIEASETQLSGLEEIRHAANMATALTRQLLVFARKQNPRPERLDLSAVTAATAETLLRRLIPENVALELELASESAPIRADRSQIEQLILNLALNAQDAMPDGGLLRVKTTILNLEDRVSNYGLEIGAGPAIRLTVTDTGIGIPPESLPQLFDPFFTTKDHGTGLGLATVYGIVRQSGGAIQVESIAGWGSSFHVYLPLDVSDAPVGTEQVGSADLLSAHEPETRERQEVVMVVEDVPEIGAMLGSFLSRQGYEILRADLPHEALELAKGHDGAIDLLLTDVVMPEMSGPALAEIVTRDRPDIKVLFMSGYAQAELRKQIDDIDGAFLRKPFALADLARTVRSLLGDRKAA